MDNHSIRNISSLSEAVHYVETSPYFVVHWTPLTVAQTTDGSYPEVIL